MLRILATRIIQTIPVLFVVSIIIFSVTKMLPGDPTFAILGENASETERQRVIELYGFDEPLPVQYMRWAEQVLSGDFGRSVRTREPVVDVIASRIPVTVQLAVMSTLFAVALGVPLGVLAAIRRNTVLDAVASFIAVAGMAVPNFWAGILLIILFTVTLQWLPPSGFVPFADDPWRNLQLMILPTLTLGTTLAGLIMRQTRASMIGALRQDYVRTAEAKGLSARRILLRHVLRNALGPVVTVTGLQIGKILSGAVIVESIFSLPGVGQMIVEAIFSRDFPVIQASIMMVVLLIMAVNLLVDIAYTALDPRIRL